MEKTLVLLLTISNVQYGKMMFVNCVTQTITWMQLILMVLVWLLRIRKRFWIVCGRLMELYVENVLLVMHLKQMEVNVLQTQAIGMLFVLSKVVKVIWFALSVLQGSNLRREAVLLWLESRLRVQGAIYLFLVKKRIVSCVRVDGIWMQVVYVWIRIQLL